MRVITKEGGSQTAKFADSKWRQLRCFFRDRLRAKVRLKVARRHVGKLSHLPTKDTEPGKKSRFVGHFGGRAI